MVNVGAHCSTPDSLYDTDSIKSASSTGMDCADGILVSDFPYHSAASTLVPVALVSCRLSERVLIGSSSRTPSSSLIIQPSLFNPPRLLECSSPTPDSFIVGLPRILN